MSQQSNNITGPKLKLHYRFICTHCAECTDVLAKEVQELHGVGAGRDYTGDYDGGRSKTRVKCGVCSEENKFNGTIESNIKEKKLFKKFNAIE